MIRLLRTLLLGERAVTTDFVFMHGGGRGGWCWEPTIEAIQQERHPAVGRLLALDMPGAGGKKDVTPEQCTMQGYVDSAVRDILAADARNIVLVGHSFAGLVMPYVVRRIPDRIKRTVFMACAVPPEGHSLRDLLALMGKVKAGTPMGSRGPARDHFRGEWDVARSTKRLGPDRARWLLDNLQREFAAMHPMPAEEKVVRDGFLGLRPVTWIVLTRDKSMPPAWQRRFAKWVGASELLEVEAQHDAMISRPADVADALLRYA
jgi:pimeloyl-ACP methyl ester carboxylesterase